MFLLSLLLAPLALADDINSIEHVIIWMQENRPFDHYYGMLAGVRGFADRAAIKLPSGNNAFYQPVNQQDLSIYQLPFHASTATTSSICMSAPQMDYVTDILMYNGGRCDSWNTARAAGMGMSYFTKDDLPYYYALSEAVTIGDQYHQSTFTQTNPNRLHLFSGSNGLSVGQKPFMDNSEPNPGHTWTTVGEVLENANISWRVYQMADNFDDNGFSWFANYQKAKPGNPLYDKGQASVPDLVGAFAADVASDSLPSVSILVGPAALSEHAAYHPSAGEDLTARLIKALVSNPAVYKKSAMLFNYDEGGQFFDHAVPYTIPLSADGTDGESTVSTHEEDNNGLPIGPGFRVPFMAISPWSRGGYVVSELFDHTSCIRFLETRFNISVPTISPWRRAMLGDLTSAFNFSAPDYSVDWVAGLPDTSAYPAEAQKECDTLPPPKAPAVQSFPVPYKGVRPSRALPYTLTTTATCGPSGLLLTWNNSGAAGMPLQVFDYAFTGTHMPGPRKYAIEAGKVLSAKVPWPAPYSVVAHSVNGYARVYQGNTCEVGGEEMDVTYDAPHGKVVLVFTGPAVYNVTDLAYGTGSTTVTAPVGGIAWAWDASASGNHYDFGVESGTQGWYRRAMGRMETGVESTSDPAMGTAAPALHPFTHPATHPELPEVYRVIERAQKLTPAQLKTGQKNEFHKDTTLSQRFDKEF